jgi:hypothetical protein
VGLIISSSAAAEDPVRIQSALAFIKRIKADSPLMGLNALRMHFAPSELPALSPTNQIITAAHAADVTLVADSINSPFRKLTRMQFKQYIASLIARGFRVFVLDDAQNLADFEILAINQIIKSYPGCHLILSTDMGNNGANAVRIRNLCSYYQMVFELQTYRQREAVSWVPTWITDQKPGCWAFEFFKTDSGAMTKEMDITHMGSQTLDLPYAPWWLMIYGHDDNTNLLSSALAPHWKAMSVIMHKFWQKNLGLE